MIDFAPQMPDTEWLRAIASSLKFVLAIAFYSMLIIGTTLYALHCHYSRLAAPYRAIAGKYLREKAIAGIRAADNYLSEAIA